MAYEVIRRAPQLDDFTRLSEHQEQTPGTFFGGKAVLHFHCADVKLRIARDDLATQADFAALGENSNAAPNEEGTAEMSTIDVWVTSRHLILWSTAKATGVQIPYPTITLHAQDGNAVLLQLSLSDPNMTADEDLEALQMRILPNAAGMIGDLPSAEVEPEAETHTNGDIPTSAPQQRLYGAISACQELNPDPNPSDDDEEGGGGGFDETAPGATGWITSENMADFMDEDGNFRMPEGVSMIGGNGDDVDGRSSGTMNGLGAGAVTGTRRTAAEVDAEDGAEDESKWQRTG